MGQNFEACMWCGRGYPPASPSREHVLPDYLGVSLRLERGRVCADCNHRLNREVDEPFRNALASILSYLGVRSSKRPVGGSVLVDAQTNIGPVPARLRGGKLEFSPRRMISTNTEDGAQEVSELWVCAPDQKGALLASRGEHYGPANVREVGSGVVRILGFQEEFTFTGSVLQRAVVKAGINLIAFRRPDLLAHTAIVTGMRYVLDTAGSEPDLPCVTEGDPVRTTIPEHEISVFAEAGRECWFSLFVFGDIGAAVRVTGAWDGAGVCINEKFVVDARS